MARRRNKLPFQLAETDLATVAKALGRQDNEIDFTMICALRAGLQTTESPLKDAVDRLWDREDAEREWERTFKAYGDCLNDTMKSFWKSCLKKEAEREYQDLLAEQRIMVDKLIALCVRKMTGSQELLYHRR